MAIDRRKQLLAGALVIVLGAVAYWVLAPLVLTSSAGGPASNPVRGTAPARGQRAGVMTAPDVHLSALDANRPKPVDAQRNLFRFKPKTPVVAPALIAPATAPVAPALPPGPPPPPPIPLKFIGTVQPGRTTIAVLTDGEGQPMYGKEGDTIAGRYRILRIGVESIELSYLDGQGRQTIRRTGS